MYSVARYNAWISACGWPNATEMKEAKEEIIGYFAEEFKKMLEENLDGYIEILKLTCSHQMKTHNK